MTYRGMTVTLPVGQQGFSGTVNQSQALPGHLLYTDGAELEAGIIRKEGGAQKVNSVALGSGATVVSGKSWSPDAGVTHDLVFLDNGNVRRDAGSGTFATSLVSGLNDAREPPPWFEAGGGESVGADRKLFMASSTNQMQVVVGTAATMAAISGPAADWASSFPTFAVQHDLRMWAGGNASDPHRLYYTPAADHEDFASGGTLSVYPGEGERIVGAVSFRGALLVFKYPKGIYLVTTTDPTPANWRVDRYSTAVGTLSQHTIVSIENDVLFMDRVGNIHALSATNIRGDVNTSNISAQSDLDQFFRTDVNLTELQRAVGAWYQARRQVIFALPLGASLDNSLRLIGEIQPGMEGRTNRWFMSRRDVCVSLWMSPDASGVDRPRVGDDAGFIWQLDTEARNRDGAAYSITFNTADTDLGFADPNLAYVDKNFTFLTLVSEPSGDFDLTANVYVDNVLTSTVVFSLAGGGVPLGEFELDADALGSNFTKTDRQGIEGSGRRIRLEVTNDGADEVVSIAAFYLSFTVGDEFTGRADG